MVVDFPFECLPPGKVQIPGFADDDSHVDVIEKAAKGLGINECTQSLSLMMSSGLVKNMPLSNGKAWTLGNFVEDFGGAQAKKRLESVFPMMTVTPRILVQRKVYIHYVTKYTVYSYMYSTERLD